VATYVITEACIGVKDATCVDVCPVACIHTTPDAPMYYIDPEVCIACEQCFFVCPVNAIYLDTDLPDGQKHYLQINADFFAEHKAETASISETRAESIAVAIRDYATAGGHAIAISVTDAAGIPLATARTDGATAEAAERALNKAYTSALLQVATHQLARGAEKPSVVVPDGFQESRMLPEGGGYPIFEGNDVVGAVGVDGSGSPQLDLQCCQSGLAASHQPG
jgi:ferredoxin